ncbi:MAG: trypsin-like peptidase domain-containing protein [Gammaproteobacteria bacterium]
MNSRAWNQAWLIRALPLAVLVLVIGTVPSAQAATVTSEIQRSVRGVTFEVVVPKAKEDRLAYDKPLPLELLPFVERNDKYWSIGTAFAIGPGQFVTAGHVFLSVLGSQFGPPALRDSAGNVYPVGQVTRFSSNEDFVVFTAAGPANVKALDVNRQPVIDEPVYAVGNALGEGIIIRDGLYTSETPEQQDGRWKWIRFSAAASPGNSGGPLLDSAGRVIGVVIGKSPNENLNFALPIARVLNAPEGRATFDENFVQKLPNLNSTLPGRATRQFALPLNFPEFASAYLKIVGEENQKSRALLRKTYANELFPAGAGSAKVLATVVNDRFPRLLGHDGNSQWQAADPDGLSGIDVPGGVRIDTASQYGVGLFRMSQKAGAGTQLAQVDSKAFMDLLLKGQRVMRQVGTDAVRVTSLGTASRDDINTDSFGRQWQRRIWPLSYIDGFAVTLSLAVPDGHVGLVQTIPAAGFEAALENLELMRDYFYVSYGGTLPQWSNFLSATALRPTAFKELRLKRDKQESLEVSSPNLSMKLRPEALAVDDKSNVTLLMTFMLAGDRLNWDVGGVVVTQDPDKKTQVSVVRQPRPSELAGDEVTVRWKQMVGREAPFNSLAKADVTENSFWIVGIADPSGSRASAANAPAALYEVTCVAERDVLPWDLEEMLRMTLRDLVVTDR